ncbi:MAG: endonuclease domain-containing protein, partial [Candidatus Heimdallarchaeaceae archaeon]
MNHKKKFIQLKQNQLKDFRYKQWLKQGKKCAITNKTISFEETVVDHCHKTKKEIPGIDGKGLIRGVIHFGINALEGKISNAYKRYGLHKIADLPEILRGLASYLEDPPIKGILHPSCIPKVKKRKLSKTDVKRVRKYWKQMYPNRKFPKVTKTLTKKWKEYIEQ